MIFIGTPRHINYEAVLQDLNAVDGVKLAHNLHIWSLTMSKTAAAAHLALGKPIADVTKWEGFMWTLPIQILVPTLRRYSIGPPYCCRIGTGFITPHCKWRITRRRWEIAEPAKGHQRDRCPNPRTNWHRKTMLELHENWSTCAHIHTIRLISKLLKQSQACVCYTYIHTYIHIYMCASLCKTLFFAL